MEIPGEIPTLVSPEYCFADETQLIIKPERKLFSPMHHRIENVEGTLVFDVKQIQSWNHKRVVRDRSGEPIILLRYHSGMCALKWSAYRGTDENDANLLFTMRKSGYLKWTWDVYLPTIDLRDSSTPDFILEVNSMAGKHTVLHNGTPIAMAENISIFSRQHLVTVYPGVDSAFVSALFTALDVMRRKAKQFMIAMIMCFSLANLLSFIHGVPANSSTWVLLIFPSFLIFNYFLKGVFTFLSFLRRRWRNRLDMYVDKY